MPGFLKRAISLFAAYSTGCVYERAYKQAELSAMIYVHRRCQGSDEERIAASVWSHLFCTEPTDPDVLAIREHCRAQISSLATQLLESDESFREVMISTLWVALAICRSRDDRIGFDRIMGSETFRLYSAAYPMLSESEYLALVENWARGYRP